MQKYIKSPLFSNNEIEILSKLRSRNIEVKSNFKNKYTDGNGVMNLECSMTGCSETEDQEHLLSCNILINRLGYDPKNSVKYSDVFSKTRRQKKVVQVYASLLEVRSTILEER